MEPSSFSINNRAWQFLLWGKRTQSPDREHPCSCRANPCIRARVLLYVIAMSRYLRKTWKNPKGVPGMALPDLAAIDMR